MTCHEHSFGKIIILDGKAIGLVERKNVLGAAKGETVRCASADIECGKTRAYAFGGI